MEELPGAIYLFNLSLLAISFAIVSTLVMLVRQTLGGKLSNFDVYLITSYVSFGFVIAFNAILPPLVSLFIRPPRCCGASPAVLRRFCIAACSSILSGVG